MSYSTDRTPEQMFEDSVLWSRAGYPAVAVGRYRDAANQIKALQAELLKESQMHSDATREREQLRADLADALQVCGGNLKAGLEMKAERDAYLAVLKRIGDKEAWARKYPDPNIAYHLIAVECIGMAREAVGL